MKLKWIATCTSALFLVGLFASSLASAQGLPVKGGVINACVKTKGKKKQRGTIRVVKSANQCKRKKGELPVTWNLQGPAGAVGTQGSAGEPGASGAQGATGAAGAQGQRGEAGSAAAVEGQLREVISRQSKEIEKLSGGLINLNAELGALEGTLDTVEQTVKGTVNGLLAVEGGVGSLEGVTKGLENGAKTLTETVGKQCTSLTTIANQGNGLLGVVGKILGVPLVGSAIPGVELPKETKLPIC